MSSGRTAGAGQIVDRRAEVRAIENVEELSPDAEVDVLRQPKTPLNGDVDLECARSLQDVPSEVALLSRRRGAEWRGIEDLLRPGYCGPNSSSGTAGFTFGRYRSMVPAANEMAPTTLTGGADRANRKLSSDQPPSAARTMSGESGVGTYRIDAKSYGIRV